MRKTLLFILFLCIPLVVFAQDATQFTSETDHYRVYSDTSQAQADDIAKRMEAAVPLYNDVFHFDVSLLATKLRVRIFKDIDSFNDYLGRVLSQKRADFVFIAWSDPERSELLCFPKDEPTFTASLLHQGAIQFVKAFVDNPPVWLREGVATYLETALWDANAGAYTAKPNFAWLDQLKSLLAAGSATTPLSVADLLSISREKAQSQMDVFAPESWGFVQFLMSAPARTYGRAMWDSLTALSPKATLDENSQRVRARAFSWFADQTLQQDFQTYILSLKTSTDLLKDGIDQYGSGDLAAADASLKKCIDLDTANSTAWYYVGLISYAKKDYAKAEEDYMKSFQLGATAGIINYALGVNSFAAGKNADATKYLSFAKTADKTTYGDRVDALLKRIDSSK
jgi:tetratricopeptide (TPR) repeat protein